MGQALRATQMKDVATFGETLRKRIDAGIAVKRLNALLRGQEMTRLEFDAIRYAIDKCLPTLQAIAVKVTHEKSSDINDLQSRARELGIDPAILLSVPEKKPEPVTIDQEGGTPDDDE